MSPPPPPPPQLVPKTPERTNDKTAQPLSSAEATIVITSDDDDVRFVSETTHGRPRKRRRKVPSMPDQTPDTPTKKIWTTSSPNTLISNRSPGLNQSDATPTKRRRGSVPVITPTVLVPRSSSPQPPLASHPSRPLPLYSIPAYVPPPPPPSPLPPSPPRKRRHPWNSKLFASLAQTLQHAFPFEEFAAKHERPVSEVLDVFSACVQLPLLGESAEGLAMGAKRAREAVKNFQDMRRAVKAMTQKEAR